MSPKFDPVRVKILSKAMTQEQVNYLSRSANGYPNQIQWTAPKGPHTVHFPAGVFTTGAVKLRISGDTPQPVPPLELIPPAEPGQTEEAYPDYIDVKVKGEVRAMSRAKPPIIIVRP